MPRLSQDMESGVIIEWLKQEGDAIDRGEILLVVETDKSNVDVEAPENGILLRILAPAGADYLVGTPIAVIGVEGDEFDASTTIASRSESATPQAVVRLHEPISPAAPSERHLASPAAKRVAAELGVDLGRVVGTGANGLIGESDVRAHVESVGAAVAAPAKQEADVESDDNDEFEAIALEGMRRRIADRVALSRRTAADVTTIIDVSMDAVARDRRATGLSYTTYIAHAIAQALVDFPDLNATLVGDEIRRYRSVNLGVAVDLDDGLVVAVVRGAQRLAGPALETEIRRLVGLVRSGAIQPADKTGGTFTVTNSGIFGSLLFTPIINVPEVAILGIGRVADVPVVRDDQIVPGKVVYLSLTYDHRAVDGATAVKFLTSVKQRLQDVKADSERC